MTGVQTCALPIYKLSAWFLFKEGIGAWLLTKKERADRESSYEAFGFCHGKVGILMPITPLVKLSSRILKREIK